MSRATKNRKQSKAYERFEVVGEPLAGAVGQFYDPLRKPPADVVDEVFMKVCSRALLILILAFSTIAGAQSTPPPLFNPARHMRVSEVRPGMTGYGLTVFKGDAIERFDVEVVSILHNFNPKGDVVLIRAK